MKRLYLLFLTVVMLGCQRASEHYNYSDNELTPDSIYIEEKEFDFGQVADSVSQVSHTFKILNLSSLPKRIKRIERSCGCTNISLSDTIIAPDSMVFATIRVDIPSTYKYFERDVTFYFEESSSPVTIYLKASRPVPKHMIAREFPLKLNDNIRLNLPYLIIGNVAQGESKTGFINILNSGDRKANFTARLQNEDDSVFSLIYEEDIEASDISKIVVLADLSDVDNFWGRYSDNIIITVGPDSISIPVEAIVTGKPDTDSYGNARIMVPSDHFTVLDDDGEIKFEIHNIGNAELKIFKINTTPEIDFHLNSNIIDTGQKLILTIDKKNIEKGTTEIEINTNDQKEPLKIVRISR